MKQTCGRTPETGCLYDVYADEGEHNNLAAAKPDVYNSMLAELHEVQQGVYSPMRGARSKAACEKGLGDYGSFWGPFVGVPISPTPPTPGPPAPSPGPAPSMNCCHCLKLGLGTACEPNCERLHKSGSCIKCIQQGGSASCRPACGCGR